MVFFVPLVEVRLLTGLWASTLINLRWGDTDGQDGVVQGGNDGYPEMLVPGGGVEPPWAEARGILSREWDFSQTNSVDHLQEVRYGVCWLT